MENSKTSWSSSNPKLFGVHPKNMRHFKSYEAHLSFPGEICVCGHPKLLHSRRCQLSSVCGCTRDNSVLLTDDQRPFFNITHGPWESHALFRGIQIARNLNIDFKGAFECDRLCEYPDMVGPVRITRTGNSISAKAIRGEKHRLYCNRCLDYLSSYRSGYDWPSRFIDS